MHLGGRSAVPRCDLETYVNMFSTRCTEEETYTRRGAAIVRNHLSLAEGAPTSHSLDYVAFTRSTGRYFLTNFEYWFKEILFEHRLCVKTGSMLFFNWHCVNILGIPTRALEQLFVQLPSWWSSYMGSSLLFASTPLVFAYHPALVLLTGQLSLLFLISVAEKCLHALISFFSSAALGGPSHA